MGRSGRGAVGMTLVAAMLGATVLLSAAGGAFGPVGGPLPSDRIVSEACGPSSGNCSTSGPNRTAATDSASPDSWNPSLAFAWTEGTAAPADPGEGAGLAAGPNGTTAVLFGGEAAGVLSNRTVLYHASGNGTWTNVTGGGPAPSARAYFSLASDPGLGTAVLFGGVVNASGPHVDNSTWRYDFSTARWTNVTSGLAPPARSGAAFAIDPAGGYALLYGGWNPKFTPISSVTYGDLWKLNLTTDVWSAVTVVGPGAPPPLQGASLAYDPSLGTFQLFGGCYPCASTVWNFDPSTGSWQEVGGPAGAAPGPRGYATWAWEPVHGSDLLFGGEDGTTLSSPAYEYFPNGSTWVQLETGSPPDPRFAAAGAWMGAGGNASLLLTGGNLSSGSPADLWDLVPTSNLTVTVLNASSGLGVGNAAVKVDQLPSTAANASGVLALTEILPGPTVVNVSGLGYADSSVSFHLPPASSLNVTVNLTWVPPTTLVLTVVSPVGAPIAGAEVNVTLGPGVVAGSPWVTNALGVALVEGLPSGVPAPTAHVTAWDALNYTSPSEVPLRPGAVEDVELRLTPFPYLELRVLGALANGTRLPLWHASILVDQIPFGQTAPDGWRNATTPVPGPIVLSVSAFGFRTVYPEYSLPRTGPFNATVVLQGVPFGQIEVTILDAETGEGLDGATAFALPLAGEAGTTIPTAGITGTSGVVELLVPIGSYNVSASAYGYFPNETREPVVVAQGNTTDVTLLLRLLPGATVDVLVHDVTTARPLDGALVSMGGAVSALTDPSGWANFTDVHFGLTQVNVTDTGYRPNATDLYLAPAEFVPRLLINLTPARANPAPNHNPPVLGAFSGFETEVAQLAPFLVLLVLLVVGVGGYLVVVHARGRDDAPAPELPAADPAGGPAPPP